MNDGPTEPAPEPFRDARSTVELHDHAVFVYDDEQGLGRGLASFIDDATKNDRFAVFVHAFDSDDEAWQFVLRHAPAAAQLRSTDLFLVSLYTTAFQGAKPTIDYPHVTSVVSSLVERAASLSKTGLSIFVDASRRYFHSRRDDEWFAFEQWLGRRLQARAGLVCAYRRADIMRPDAFSAVLHTHAYRFGPADA